MLKRLLFLVSAAALIGGCTEDNSTAPRDLTPPAAPRGVYSVTGDHTVWLHWYGNTEGDVAGYHYYPGRKQVVDWFAAEHLEVLDEAFKQEDGWGYRHFLLRHAQS